MVIPPVGSTNPEDQLSPAIIGEKSLGRDEFLRLLVAQLENQDPSKPIESTDFTAQLAQFTELEQIFDLNDQFRTFLAQQSLSTNFNAVGFIGKEIETPTIKGTVTGIGLEGNEPILFVGSQQVPLSSVLRVNAAP